MLNEPIESYYLETHEGLFFAVKGLEHPPDRVIAVLRYVPDEENGDRRKGRIPYRRLYHFREQEQWLKEIYPYFVAFDPIFNTTLQSVPRSHIQTVYDPRQRLQEMVQAPARPIEEDAAAFGALLREKAHVPWSAVGISGSLLIGLDTDQSDLDVSVFGTENSRKIYDVLHALLDSQTVAGLRRNNRKETEELYRQRVADTWMSFDEFAALEKEKVCQGIFRQRPYFIRFIKRTSEFAQRYGDARYTPLGKATITAMIEDDRDSIFTPCRYGLKNVHTLEGLSSAVTEIVSFRGRFCEQARTSDAVRAVGTLERVESRTGGMHYRLLLGDAPQDTMIRAS
jgi:uncharacterized protein